MPRETLTIRLAEPSDYDKLWAFFQENNRADVTAHFQPFPLTEESARFICHEEKKDRYYLAFDGEQLIGLSMLRGWDEGYDIPAYGLIIDYRLHTKGFGTVVVNHAFAEARSLGSPGVRITTHATNDAVNHFCRKHGFEMLSKEPIELDGKPNHKIVWQLNFTPDSA
ncbi:MAG: GNAT family N-acetyltransferase [Chloroflexi bacterium]|nr:GNAT family N-acetyltransferase [Chloroflexota bacterium]